MFTAVQGAQTAAMIPLRIRFAAALLVLFGITVLAWTVLLTVPLVANPDPMLGLELMVSATLSVGAVGAIGAGVGLIRSAAWGRPAAIGVAVLLIVVAAIFIVPNLGSIGGYGPPLIDPMVWLLGAAGLVMLALVARPYRSL
jgi:hypothetical protein